MSTPSAVPRLHALQGRASVTCPVCGHILAHHTDGRCSVCIEYVVGLGYTVAQGDQEFRKRGLCATRADDPGGQEPEDWEDFE